MRVNEYWILKGATLDRDQSDEWQLRVRPLDASDFGETREDKSRVLRGDQSYSTMHLGSGTKWVKPRR